jgi:hypothetical protein
MSRFKNVEMFAGVLPWHVVPRLRGVVPQPVREQLERRCGWFLYAKGFRA